MGLHLLMHVQSTSDYSKCEIHSFFKCKDLKAVKIHLHIRAVYGANIIKWQENEFKYGRTNVHNKKQSGQPSLMLTWCRKIILENALYASNII